jgi:predicted nucleotidyltransferase
VGGDPELSFLIFHCLVLLMNRQTGKDQLTQRIQAVLSGLPFLRVAYLYGSYLSREDFRDIDIALLVGKEIGKREALSYVSRVADLIEAAIAYRYECDAHIINTAPAPLSTYAMRRTASISRPSYLLNTRT